MSLTRREFLEALAAAIVAGIPLHTRAGDAAASDSAAATTGRALERVTSRPGDVGADT